MRLTNNQSELAGLRGSVALIFPRPSIIWEAEKREVEEEGLGTRLEAGNA